MYIHIHMYIRICTLYICMCMYLFTCVCACGCLIYIYICTVPVWTCFASLVMIVITHTYKELQQSLLVDFKAFESSDSALQPRPSLYVSWEQRVRLAFVRIVSLAGLLLLGKGFISQFGLSCMIVFYLISQTLRRYAHTQAHLI